MTFSLYIRHYGTFRARLNNRTDLPLGAKHQALLALLSTAEDGVRTRAFLEKMLWGLAQPAQSKASLRTALSTLRREFGPEASELLTANRERVILNMDRVVVEDRIGAGIFMDGFSLPHEAAFSNWLEQQRDEPTAKAPTRPVAAKGERKRFRVDALLPSIAVLPFVNRADMGGVNPLGSILAEEMTRLLSRSRGFGVTSYLTMRQFNPATALASDIARICKVQFLLTGSVVVSGQSYRLTADLQDAIQGRLLWSQEFVGNLQDLLAGDASSLLELTMQIGRSVRDDALRLTRVKPLSQLENHTLLMAAIPSLQDMRADRFNAAHELLTLLVQREPDHPLTLSWLGFWHVMRVQKGLSPDRVQDIRLAQELADRALQSDGEFSLALTLKGLAQSHLNGGFDLADASYDQAIGDNPSEALALLLKGAMLALQDAPDDAVALTEAARRLSPLDPQGPLFDAVGATAHLAAHRFDQAILLADRSLEVNRTHPSPLRTKAIALEMSGQGDAARAVVKDLMQVAPDFTVAQYLQEEPAAAFPVGRDWARALQSAGVPD